MAIEFHNLSHSQASGGAKFLAYTKNGNIDALNNTGWIFDGGFTPRIILID